MILRPAASVHSQSTTHRADILAAAAILSCVLVFGTSARGGTTACTRQIVAVDASKPSTLNSVAVAASNDVLAVGTQGEGGSRPLVERYDGRRWLRVTPPFRRGQLHDVGALSPTDIWASGTMGVDTPAVFRLTGAHWKRIALPKAAHWAGAIDASVNAGVWLDSQTREGFPSALHWTDRGWTIARAGLPRQYAAGAGRSYSTDDIAMISPRSGWLVGSGSDAYGIAHRYVARWDGRRWRTVSVPSAMKGAALPRGGEEVSSVDHTGPSEVYATGFADSSGFQGVFVIDWNGKRWRLLRAPGGPGALKGSFGGAGASIVRGRSGEKWLVSYYDGAAHLSGANWSLIPGSSSDVTLHAVASDGHGSAWAVGDRLVGDPALGEAVAVVERLRCER